MTTDTESVAPDKTAQNGTPRKLSRRKQTAIAAILDSSSMEEAAAFARIGRTTLYQYLREPAFREELARRQDELFSVALSRLKVLVGNAVTGLGELIGAKSEAVKRSACKDVLDAALKVRELHEMEARLQAIEKRLEEKEAAR